MAPCNAGARMAPASWASTRRARSRCRPRSWDSCECDDMIVRRMAVINSLGASRLVDGMTLHSFKEVLMRSRGLPFILAIAAAPLVGCDTRQPLEPARVPGAASMAKGGPPAGGSQFATLSQLPALKGGSHG